ncbi:hypothetical protein MRX96_051143 [Rhipicephalus microplus]
MFCTAADFQDTVDLMVPGDTLGGALDYDGVLDTALLNGGLAIRGIDGLVRAVHVIGNTSGNQGSGSMLELGAPIEDMYPHMVLDMGKLDLKSAILLMRVDDDAKMQKLQDFITSFNQPRHWTPRPNNAALDALLAAAGTPAYIEIEVDGVKIFHKEW